MSILIKGMEMPVSCAACSLRSYDIDDQRFCGADREGRSIHFDLCRPSWCPIVPVPPHGRLIDADALRDKWMWGRTDRLGECECIELIDLDNAPTIIPADHIGDANEMVGDSRWN